MLPLHPAEASMSMSAFTPYQLRFKLTSDLSVKYARSCICFISCRHFFVSTSIIACCRSTQFLSKHSDFNIPSDINTHTHFPTFLHVDDVRKIGQVSSVEVQQVRNGIQVLARLLGKILSYGLVGLASVGDGFVQAN